MDYKKFYNLEEYLFEDVRKHFQSREYLTPKEFFCIVIWKSNRAKTRIKSNILGRCSGTLNSIIKKLTKEIYRERNTKKRLEILLNDWGFRLPMASAILTVLYPEEYTIYDYRVRKQIGMSSDFSGKKNQIEQYFTEFLPRVRRNREMRLRDSDKYLWGKSFYQDLIRFLADT